MPHYDNVGEPTLQTIQAHWFSGEQPTKNGYMYRGMVLADDGRTGIANLVQFNGKKPPSGELTGMFQIVEVTPDNGDPYTQYVHLG